MIGQRPWTSGHNPLRLTELEVAAGVVHSSAPHPPEAGRTSEQSTEPREALDRVLLPLLERPPVVVGFSGGRDSSVLLALLVRLARREGLPMPVALTMHRADDPDSQETEWQESIIQTLGVDAWEKFDPGTDLDLLGPVARDSLLRHGLLWPAPLYALRPLLKRATGGTLVTGEGGDQVFGGWRLGGFRTAIARRRVPDLEDVRDACEELAPRRLRRWAARRWLDVYQEWLRPEAHAAETGMAVRDATGLPRAWDRSVVAEATARDLQLMLQGLRLYGAEVGAGYAVPFLDPCFVGGLARLGGTFGLGDRTTVMCRLFDDVVPRRTLTRVSKASFGGVFWGPSSRAFAETWDGRGLAGELVDREALRQAWLAPLPVYGSALPLQAAWLCQNSHLSNP